MRTSNASLRRACAVGPAGWRASRSASVRTAFVRKAAMCRAPRAMGLGPSDSWASPSETFSRSPGGVEVMAPDRCNRTRSRLIFVDALRLRRFKARGELPLRDDARVSRLDLARRVVHVMSVHRGRGPQPTRAADPSGCASAAHGRRGRFRRSTLTPVVSGAHQPEPGADATSSSTSPIVNAMPPLPAAKLLTR